MQDFTIEDLAPLFVTDEEGLKISPSTKLARCKVNGERFYFERGKGAKTRLLPSVSTFLNHYIPAPPHLLKWMVENGTEGEAHRDRRASYGTCMHVLIERLIKAGYNLSKQAVYDAAYEFIHEPTEAEICDLGMDVCAFAVWAKEHDLKVVALEVPLYSENLGISGMCDLVGMITVKTGKTEHRVNCLVDFKSGRKGFFERHAYQLHIYRDMWNEMYGNVFAVKRVFNWSPKDWKKAPTCHFEEQTSEKIEFMLQKYYEMEAAYPMTAKKEVFMFLGIEDGLPSYSKTNIIDIIAAKEPQTDNEPETADPDVLQERLDEVFEDLLSDFGIESLIETLPAVEPETKQTNLLF